MEVQVVSSEMIKPFSPTPENLRIYKLSFLDQISLKVYSPFIYFYSLSNDESNNHIAEISNKLKKSLSQALTLYYPLAGRPIDGQDLLECNDEGALYTEARTNVKLSDILKNPIPLELNKLLPLKLDELATLPLGIQLNAFDCGGIAIGVCFSHHLGDALASLMFVRTWMAIARGQSDTIVSPIFGSEDLFPRKDLRGYDLPVVVKKNMCSTNTTKRFVFESSKLETLREKYQEKRSHKDENSLSNTCLPKRVSRVEALSTFIWTRFVDATKLAESGLPAKEYLILQAVNIRPRCDPPLPIHSFGNYYSTSLTNGLIRCPTGEEYEKNLVRAIREDIRKIDTRFVEYMRAKSDEFVESLKKETSRFESGEVIRFFISSLCRFPLYEADFGFGKPTWVSSAARGFNNSVVFFDDKKGDGIEAYICLKPEDMERLEADKEFLSCFISS